MGTTPRQLFRALHHNNLSPHKSGVSIRSRLAESSSAATYGLSRVGSTISENGPNMSRGLSLAMHQPEYKEVLW
jgi:hypothetical protein